MRIVIAEDQYLLREGIKRLLVAYGHEVIAEAQTGPETLKALTTHRPDVGLVDVRMPPTNTDEGLVAALEARRQTPGLPIVVLSQHVEQLYARQLLADSAGGVGYLLKDKVFDAEPFIDALERVAQGGTAIDTEVIGKLLGRPATEDRLGDLTSRERDVLALMAEGLSNAAISRRLHLSEGTISKYTTTTFDKLGIQDDADANRRVTAVLAYLSGTS